MTAREQLIAYIATLFALVAVIVVALLIAAWVPEVMGKMEVFGLGTVTGGLIGVLRIPSARSSIGTTESGDVNLTPKEEAAP